MTVSRFKKSGGPSTNTLWPTKQVRMKQFVKLIPTMINFTEQVKLDKYFYIQKIEIFLMIIDHIRFIRGLKMDFSVIFYVGSSKWVMLLGCVHI